MDRPSRPSTRSQSNQRSGSPSPSPTQVPNPSNQTLAPLHSHSPSRLTPISLLTRTTHPPPPPPPPPPPAVASMRGHGPVADAAVVRSWASTGTATTHTRPWRIPSTNILLSTDDLDPPPRAHSAAKVPTSSPLLSPPPPHPRFNLITPLAESLCFYVRRRDLHAWLCCAAGETKAAGRREAA
jgi:hypothetical protein